MVVLEFDTGLGILVTVAELHGYIWPSIFIFTFVPLVMWTSSMQVEAALGSLQGAYSMTSKLLAFGA